MISTYNSGNVVPKGTRVRIANAYAYEGALGHTMHDVHSGDSCVEVKLDNGVRMVIRMWSLEPVGDQDG